MRFGNDTAPDVSKNILLQGKVQALRIFVAALTGEPPIVTNRGSYLDIDFTDAQKATIRRWIKNSLTAAPDEVRIDYMGLAFPAFLEVYGKIALLAIALIFMAGRISKN